MSDLGNVIDRARIMETSGGERRSLRYSLSWSANKDELRHPLAAAPYAGLLDRQALAEQTITITLARGHRRIDHSLFGEPTSVVDDGDQLVLVQHTARGYARLAKPAGPAPAAPRLVSVGAPVLTKQAAKLPGGGLGDELVVTIRDGSEHFRQRLTLDPALRIGSLARDFLSMLVGDAGRQAAGGYPFEAVAHVIMHDGLPIAGRLERTDASGKVEAEVSHFRVGDATLRDLTADAFTPPPGYRDLRAGGAAAGAPPLRPTTSQAVFGVLLEQRLLNHLRANVDLALEHLGRARFQGKLGELVMDWLAKLCAAGPR